MTSVVPRPLEPAPLDAVWQARPLIGGVPIVATTVEDASTALTSAALEIAARGRAGAHVHLASAQTIALAAKDPGLDRVINGDGWVLPDGKPISWTSRLRRDRPHLHQTRGYEVFRGVLEAGAASGLRHYLLGSTDRVLEDMRVNIARSFPDVKIAGTLSPAFRSATADELRDRDAVIRASGAHVVWVGLGTPKQDFEVARLAESLPVVAIAIGAVFDFTAGTLKVAPAWMSAIGLEWLFRLLAEPRRLWRRYTFDSVLFISTVLRYGRRRRLVP